jgi:hypothetical protein
MSNDTLHAAITDTDADVCQWIQVYVNNTSWGMEALQKKLAEQDPSFTKDLGGQSTLWLAVLKNDSRREVKGVRLHNGPTIMLDYAHLECIPIIDCFVVCGGQSRELQHDPHKGRMELSDPTEKAFATQHQMLLPIVEGLQHQMQMLAQTQQEMRFTQQEHESVLSDLSLAVVNPREQPSGSRSKSVPVTPSSFSPLLSPISKHNVGKRHHLSVNTKRHGSLSAFSPIASDPPKLAANTPTGLPKPKVVRGNTARKLEWPEDAE